MQDAVILMNCIYDIEDVTHENIKAALADYKAQRLEHALFQVDLGKTFAKIMFGQVKCFDTCLSSVLFHLNDLIVLFPFSM